ncbi:hypothetical protein [Pedosphaera parvula]|uniref:Organic solvent tolerance-like N-terminal domain-containing protein n=1 Tax=Pedosphaera parvula (strain Ellin514) TaxID=320771 RepID=B9XNT4_PEDPL|nr:hypothetical protein [Pedosphaera parvula]EEF58507.1 hypothetical protein Cflav_PD1234 [Pedosphaera parvula Ellin514]
MRTIRRPARNTHHATQLFCVLCAFLWLTLPTALFAKDAPPPTARVTSVNGKARYSTDGKTWAVVEKGTSIAAGTVIQTAGSKSQVTLLLEKKPHYGFDPNQPRDPFYTWTEKLSTLNIYENSVVSLDRLDFEKTKHGTISHTRINLRAGYVIGNLRKLPPQSDYQATCDNRTAKINPGEYVMKDDGTFLTGTGTALLETKHPGRPATTMQLEPNILYDSAPADSEFSGIDDNKHYHPRPRISQPNLRPGI